ncbi:virulence RhuM family protein [Candidatus Gracilibacteria bacterium]|nr:virulence RhuM family protein [Candidatus Gracilibacteria bacterium]
MNKGEIKIFQRGEGKTEIQVRLENETVWLSLEQIAKIFGKNKSTISRHINNIYNTLELLPERTVAKYATVQIEGNREVLRDIEYYNLDMIISVGYRVNSKQATQFRIWATSVLRDYITKGYALNQKRLKEKGYSELEGAIQLVKKALESGDISKDEALGLLDIVTSYTNTWLLLQKYDEDDLLREGKTKELRYKLDASEAQDALFELKENLLTKGEATDLFAKLREERGLEGIFGNIYQTFGGQDLYPSLEEKAAHLLYFIIKDHPFTDGNKRSGAFLFILFLAKNNILFDSEGNRKINDRALVAITLLIAESNPKDKELMTTLVLNLIN